MGIRNALAAHSVLYKSRCRVYLSNVAGQPGVKRARSTYRTQVQSNARMALVLHKNESRLLVVDSDIEQTASYLRAKTGRRTI